MGVLAANLFLRRFPTEWIGAGVATVGICAVLYRLRDTHLRLACHLTVLCLWTASTILAFHLPQSSLYLFGLVIILSNRLIPLPATVILTVSSTVLMLLVGGGEMAVGPLINVWGSLVVGVVVSRGLYQALESINRHHDYTLEQMNLARDHRAQLVRLTRALQEATEDLRHANIQLRYSREAAEEARRLKAQFAANVSHELRTPINLVIGYSEVMVTVPEVYGASLPDSYRSDIQAIYRNAKHLQELINDILDISQIEASRLAVTKEKTDLSHTLLEAATMARDLASAKGLHFRLEISAELPEVWIDRTRIRQVVLNLLANAVRFTDEGTITLRAEQDKDEIVVSVLDTGMGIAPNDLSQIFEEFYQVENSLSKRYGGTGLGLTLSQHIIQHHGGRLWAESDGVAGHGSTFSFTLPISADTKLITGMPVSTTVARHNRKCVIIFDQDAAIGQLFKRYLTRHEVVISQSREDLLRLTQIIQPSAVVLDRNWRNTDIEARIAHDNPDTTLIFCPMPSARRTAKAYSVADYLTKPIARQALINAIVALEKPIHKILIVDDERDVSRMLSRMLQTHDQNLVILQVNNGADGLVLMYQEQPDLVLLDIQMPVMDGFSVIHRMKQDPSLQHIPIIVASARGMEEEITSAVDGEITVVRPTRLTPVELVNCAEAVVNVLLPSTAPVTPGS